MSNIILFSAGAQLPAYLQDKAALALINADVASGSSFPVLSIKGKVFTLVKDRQKKVLMRPDEPDEILQNINLAVVRANKNSRVFYAKAYSEDDNEGGGAAKMPDCYSGDGVAPAGDARSPQAKKCQLCPHAVWGSRAGDSGKGTACSVNTRLAVVDPDNVGEPWLLRVPAGSRTNFADAVKVVDSRGLPYNAVIFRVGFDPLAPSPKLTFKPIGLASDAAYAKISEMYETEDVKDIVGLVAHAPRAPQVEDDTPEITADELDAALEAKKVVTTAKAKSAPVAEKPKAAKPVAEDLSLDDLDGVGEAPAAPTKAAKTAPKPTPEKPVVAEKPTLAKATPAKATSDSMADLLGDLDDLLGSTDD